MKHRLDRRGLLKMGAAMAVFAPFSSVFAAAVPTGGPMSFQGARITLLGTAGGPVPHVDRSQPANLLTVDGRAYLIDAGENVGQQLQRAGTPSPRLAAVLLTHLHWDHTLGLDYLMASGWMMGRTAPLPILGPRGTKEFVAREIGAVQLGEDIFRPQMSSRPPLASLYPAQDISISAPREIWHDDVVRVSAAPTTHFTNVQAPPHDYGPDSAYAYRFDTPYGSVTFTGDTGPSAMVESLARESDVLVTEICDFDSIVTALRASSPPGARLDALIEHMRTQHLSPQDVGEMAARAGVKKLVLSHFVMGQGFDPIGFIAKIRPYWSKGEILVGQDLLSIPL